MNDMPPEYINQIVTGDARELAKRIPDESIDLIFADPVYDRIEDYEWLAETAARVLKRDSALLVWCSHPMAARCQLLIEGWLDYVYTLTYTVQAKPYRLMHYHLFLWSTPCLWFNKGSFAPSPWIPDTKISCSNTAGKHKWNKNPEVIIDWLNAFTQPDAIVYDPFAGGGTVPAVCKMLGRNYIAFEIDPDTADKARERVSLTQPPLFVEQPTQASLLEVVE